MLKLMLHEFLLLLSGTETELHIAVMESYNEKMSAVQGQLKCGFNVMGCLIPTTAWQRRAVPGCARMCQQARLIGTGLSFHMLL